MKKKQKASVQLTPEEMIEIMIDVGLNRPSKLQSPEAKKFRKKHEAFSEEVRKKGGTVEIPFL